MKTKTTRKLLTKANASVRSAIAPTQARFHVKKWFAYILAFALVLALGAVEFKPTVITITIVQVLLSERQEAFTE